MYRNKISVKVSIAVCIILSVVLGILVFFAPFLFELYLTAFRGFAPEGEALAMIKKVFMLVFYPCGIFAAIILTALLGLLNNIKAGDVFTLKNAKYLRIVSLCCFAISVITLVGGFFYMPFLVVTFAAAFVGLLLRVLKNVMQAAAEMREENDLTI